MRDTWSELESTLVGILCLLGATVSPVCLVLYVRQESFATFSGLVIGGVIGGLATGLLLYYGLPYGIGLAALWILYCLYTLSWRPALFGLIPLVAAVGLLRWKYVVRKEEKPHRTTASPPSQPVRASQPPVPAGDNPTNQRAAESKSEFDADPGSALATHEERSEAEAALIAIRRPPAVVLDT